MQILQQILLCHARLYRLFRVRRRCGAQQWPGQDACYGLFDVVRIAVTQRRRETPRLPAARAGVTPTLLPCRADDVARPPSLPQERLLKFPRQRAQRMVLEK